MAKDIKRHLSHLKSSGGTAPAAADLVYGEIAVGYKKDAEALYIKNNNGEVITFTSAAGGEAAAEIYTDRRVISTVTGDTEISVSLNAIDETSDSGRTLTITHATGSAQSGFKKLSSDSYGHITGGSNVALSDLTGLGAVSSAITVSAGAGLTGGGNLSANRTLKAALSSETKSTLAATSMGSTENRQYAVGLDRNGVLSVNIPWTNVNSGYVPTGRTITTASGLTGGGNLGANLTIGHSNNITAGSAKTSSTSVTATPSGANIAIPVIEYDANGHIKSTGSTNVSLKVNTATTGTAGVVKIATTTGTNNTDVVMTQSAVTKAIEDSFAAQDAMVYKGLVGSGTNYGFPTTFSKGATYKVATAFTANSVSYEIGDMFIANTDVTTSENYTAAHWDAIQTNLDPTLYVNTATTVTGDGALEGGGNLSSNKTITHKALAPSGASGKTSPNAAQTPAFGENFNVPVVEYDKYGHITAVTTTTVKIPASASSWTNNYYITGATTTTAASKFDVALSGNNTAAKASFTIPSATTTAAGVMTSADKTKLNGIATGAEVNQNAFSNVKVGETTVAADAKTDTLELSAGTFVVLTPDATNDKVTIGVSTGTSSTQLARGDHSHSIYATSAFSTVSVVGASTVNVVADQKHDTITFAKDDAITLTGDATNDKVTFGLGNIECGDYA